MSDGDTKLRVLACMQHQDQAFTSYNLSLMKQWISCSGPRNECERTQGCPAKQERHKSTCRRC
ncbi:hypothetical protein NC651_013277 [Populus alba x Populus x berolinensis]|nr:hypothetical protein NC651_013277 [Populus alba x Populus x berolinensis]